MRPEQCGADTGIGFLGARERLEKEWILTQIYFRLAEMSVGQLLEQRA
jgi:hypothetical protein